MGRLLGYCAVLFLALTAGVGVVVGAGHSRPYEANLAVEDEYLPGQALPIHANCEWRDYGNASIYCRLHREAGLVIFKYVHRTQTIACSTFLTEGLKIADLVASWGPPESFKSYSNTLVQIYSSDRYAYAVSRFFSPRSRVVAIAYCISEEPRPQQIMAWAGFVNGGKR